MSSAKHERERHELECACMAGLLANPRYVSQRNITREILALDAREYAATMQAVRKSSRAPFFKSRDAEGKKK